MLLLLSAVDLESPEHQNKEVLQWENARTEIKQAKETKIYGDVGTYILYLIFFIITKTFVDNFLFSNYLTLWFWTFIILGVDSESQFTILRGDDEPKSDTEKIVFPDAGNMLDDFFTDKKNRVF